GLEELGPAIRVSRIVEGIGADEDVGRAGGLGPGDGVREKERVAGGDIGDRNRIRAEAVLRNRNRGIREGRRAALRQIETHDSVSRGPVRPRERSSAFELDSVSLAVVEGKRENVEPFLSSNQQAGCGVEAAREENDGRSLDCPITPHLPGTSPQRILWS